MQGERRLFAGRCALVTLVASIIVAIAFAWSTSAQAICDTCCRGAPPTCVSPDGPGHRACEDGIWGTCVADGKPTVPTPIPPSYQGKRYAELLPWAAVTTGGVLAAPRAQPTWGEWQLRMQSDCNLVLVRGEWPKWNSNTAYLGSYCYLLNNDGRIFIFDGLSGRAVWQAALHLTPDWGASLRLYADGGLVLIRDGRPLWWAVGVTGNFGQDPWMLWTSDMHANQTLYAGDVLRSSNGQYRLDMQSDCNLVLYTWEFWRGRDFRSNVRLILNTVGPFNPIWATGTYWKSSECRMVFQGDGNLVVYDWQGQVMWASGTYAPGAILRMQDDGNLVIYNQWGSPVWATDTMNQR